MDEAPRLRRGVNTPAHVSAVALARWQGALSVVLGRYGASGLSTVDARALEAYRALEAGRWLEGVLWLGEGPVVDRWAALADPLGSLLAAVVLRCAGVLVEGAARGRACPFWRALGVAYLRACHRRPLREPMAWVIEALLRAGGDSSDLAAVEAACAEVLDARRVAELVELHERDWEAEALARLLATGGGDHGSS